MAVRRAEFIPFRATSILHDTYQAWPRFTGGMTEQAHHEAHLERALNQLSHETWVGIVGPKAARLATRRLSGTGTSRAMDYLQEVVRGRKMNGAKREALLAQLKTTQLKVDIAVQKAHDAFYKEKPPYHFKGIPSQFDYASAIRTHHVIESEWLDAQRRTFHDAYEHLVDAALHTAATQSPPELKPKRQEVQVARRQLLDALDRRVELTLSKGHADLTRRHQALDDEIARLAARVFKTHAAVKAFDAAEMETTSRAWVAIANHARHRRHGLNLDDDAEGTTT